MLTDIDYSTCVHVHLDVSRLHPCIPHRCHCHGYFHCQTWHARTSRRNRHRFPFRPTPCGLRSFSRGNGTCWRNWPHYAPPRSWSGTRHCSTQRNISKDGELQALKIGKFFEKNDIKITKVLSSEWCRCKDTAKIAFGNYETKNFLNSFYDERFSENKDKQILDFQKFIQNWDQSGNLVLVTHYVVISEILDLATSSGEIVITDNNLEILSSFEIN